MDGLNSDLEAIDWNELFELCQNDVNQSGNNEYSELIRLTVLQLCNIHCPKKIVTATKKPKTRSLSILQRKRRKVKARLHCLQNHAPESPTISLLEETLSLLQLSLRDSITETQNKREQKAIETIKTNPRYFYSYAKRFSKLKSNIGPLKDDNGCLQQDARVMANTLQKQYCSAFSNPESTLRKQTVVGIPQGNQRCLSDIDFDRDDIVKAIDELDTYAATSHEDIPARILKECKHPLSIPLTLLWRWSFNTGVIPSYLKDQFITPIYKKGDKTDAANYRPISLTSHQIKVFERVIRDRLVCYLETHKIISDNQHGFRRGRSCLTQLLKHYDDILKNLNAGYETDVIYLDYAKAFDKVDHQLLLQKLDLYGIKGKLYNWIKSFLSNRYQTVVVDGHHSEAMPVLSGVPQGSVLGPILFIMYIDDLKNVVKSCSTGSFADDTKMQGKVDAAEDTATIQEDLDSVIAWSSKNNMSLHEDKFIYLRYSTAKSSLLNELPFTAEYSEYTTTSGHLLKPSEVARDLGVQLSSNYSWTYHIGEMVRCSRNIASWVLGVFRNRSSFIMLQLYKSLVRCRVEYCCPLWNPLKVESIQQIEDIQRYFTRRISGLQNINYWERLFKLKLLSLQRRRERYMIIHVWKILNNLAPNDINMGFNENKRLGTKVKIPAFSKTAPSSVVRLYDESFAVHSGKLWNILPKEVTAVKTLDGFKVLLGKFLFQYPDEPPTKGYSARNRNSLIDWNLQSGGLQLAQRPS